MKPGGTYAELGHHISRRRNHSRSTGLIWGGWYSHEYRIRLIRDFYFARTGRIYNRTETDCLICRTDPSILPGN